MEKKDLKNGMVVELRNMKTKYLVLDDEFVAYDGWMPTNAYNKDLKAVSRDEFFDVVKIYNTDGNSFKSRIEEDRLTLIWQRTEVDWSKVAVDTKVIISNGDGIEIKVHFSYFKNDKIYTWEGGKTSFTANLVKVTSKDHVRLYKEE